MTNIVNKKILIFKINRNKSIFIKKYIFLVESSTLYDMYFTEYEFSLTPEENQVMMTIVMTIVMVRIVTTIINVILIIMKL